MAWELLFSSDIGLLSLFTILCVIAMSIFFPRYFAKMAREDARRAEKK
jgi:Protein of unknown function (DUF3149)